jgi:hypothetical protein
MSTSTDRLTSAVARVVAVIGDRPVDALDDADIVSLVREVADARNALDVIGAAASAVVARRSTRERGQAGIAQKQGHRNGLSLLQSLTGQSKADVGRAIRAGEELVSRADVEPIGVDSSEPQAAPPAEDRWRALLREALAGGRIGQAQFAAIRKNLGEPPIERYPELDPGFLPEAWADAVTKLLDEAHEFPVEELAANARIARDRLDPVGVTMRFDERFAARSYRSWIDENGQRQSRIVWDDEAAAWVDSILQAALRPRRGPRFVDPAAAGAPDDVERDERSNEQLAYDTLVAVMRTGAAADPQQAFGDRQPGVRIVVEAEAISRDQNGIRVTGVGHLEDGGQAIPGGVVEKYLCDAGSIDVTLDSFGRPLDVGREQRLFARKQRIAIAVREGGCIGVGCTAPISQVEIHHIDHWHEHDGRTDVDDGVPLCRNHHLGLHNRGERITRERDPITGIDTYWLHSPPDPVTGELRPPRRLRSRSPRRFRSVS